VPQTRTLPKWQQSSDAEQAGSQDDGK